MSGEQTQAVNSKTLEKISENARTQRMRTFNAHFDGKFIVLDEPVRLKPNTKLKIIAAELREADLVKLDAAVRLCFGL